MDASEFQEQEEREVDETEWEDEAHIERVFHAGAPFVVKVFFSTDHDLAKIDTYIEHTDKSVTELIDDGVDASHLELVSSVTTVAVKSDRGQPKLDIDLKEWVEAVATSILFDEGVPETERQKVANHMSLHNQRIWGGKADSHTDE